MDSKKWLETEMAAWRKEGLIDANQSRRILARYQKSPQEEISSEDKHNKLIIVLSTLGAILIGIGMIVFVASNWQRIPAALKLIILYGSTIGCYVAGWKVGWDLKKFPAVGHALVFLGSIMVGVTLALTAQIFHLEANFIRFFLIWFIAVAPLSYGFRSKPTLVLSLLLFGAWLSALMANGGDLRNLAEGFFEGFGVFMFYGLTLFGLGYIHEKTPFSYFKSTYQSFGVFYTLLIIYAVVVSEFDLFNEFGQHWLSYIFLTTAFLTVIGSAIYMGAGIGKRHEFGWNLLAFLTVMAIWLIMTNESLSISRGSMSGYALQILVLFNILFFALVVLTVFSGYYQGVPSFINIGLLFFVLYIGYFYFTTVFKYLPKSLALVIGGILLLAGGWYLEKKRRIVMQGISKKHG